MINEHINRFHHTGIKGDLDALAAKYRSFGFLLTPRSRHLMSERPGAAPTLGCTANECAVFGDSYIELFGVVDPAAPDPWHAKTLAEGFWILNLDTDDPAADSARLAAAGLPASGVHELARDVDTEAGVRTMRASTVHIDPHSTPEGLLGLSQHRTPEYVHQPRYLGHPNGARGIAAVTTVVADDRFDEVVDRYRRIIAAEPVPEGPVTVLAHKEIRMEFVRASAAGEALPGEPAPRASYFAAMTIRVDAPDRARRLVESAGTQTRSLPDGFSVSAGDAYGACLRFVSC
ncbi:MULTISPECIES: VOC family protein [unclassified Nocardia]|uniref:VOC family protein n=1 Tax=unclassified Nocardia TaxID=2637762 RepID=UPI001CE3CAE2|nr:MULTISPECIES: VOC family protein [unclassified Nocardia]